MDSSALSLITVVLFLPLIGMFILLFMKEEQHERIQWTAFGFSVAVFVGTLVMWAAFDTSNPALQMVQRINWLPQYNISYYVGVDGLSLLLIVLTGFIMPLAIMSSFHAHVIHERGRVKLYYVFMMLLEFAMIGVFVAQDLFLFYIFWEVTLVPMYFLIGIWGAEQRVYAAVKFFLYTMAGSILMLLAILFLGSTAGTFALPDIIARVNSGELVLPFNGLLDPSSIQSFLFLGFFIAFAIIEPVLPLIPCLPVAHVPVHTSYIGTLLVVPP